mmetsp:Transcript_7462/g.16998  ORF Transcript_7462/g.16998 Transcript_7462/m.16998 type:complete len:203 (+) Transcript_7462:205-813(+)
MGKHNLEADTQNTLLHHNVTGSLVDENLSRSASGDEKSRLELHRLGTLNTSLARNYNFNPQSTAFHDKADDAIAGPADLKTSEELEFQGLGLSHGGETTVVDTFREHLHGSLGKSKTLLNGRSELADALTLLSKNFASSGGTDDNLRPHGGTANLHTRVAILSELVHEHFVKLSIEHSVLYELALLRDRVLRHRLRSVWRLE